MKPLPMNISLPIICVLIKTLCILHNFCINERIKERSTDNDVNTYCHSVLQNDINSINLSGGSVQELLNNGNANYNPDIHRKDKLLDIGHHSDDITNYCSRNYLIEP